MLKLLLIAIILLICEVVYFKIADHFNIIDNPNQRSSHSSVVLRGGGIIFPISMWAYSAFYGFQYPWFLLGLTLVAAVSFIDDIHSLSNSFRLLIQFISAVLVFYQLGILHWNMWWVVLISLVVYVGITNVYNFMDGINGITAGYSISVIVPIYLINENLHLIDSSIIIVTFISLLIFSLFNFRPKGKAKCFAGDVGSIGAAFIILFFLGTVIFHTHDVTYLLLLVVYGVDACLTIVHRIILHENLGVAHRKHAYQIMTNELNLGHVKVSCLYMALQFLISIFYLYVIPNTQIAHWTYLICVVIILSLAYILFMKKYYHLHDEYLKSLKKQL